jgi:hypothetical protein
MTDNYGESNSEEEKQLRSDRILNGLPVSFEVGKNLSMISNSEDLEEKPFIIEFKNFKELIEHYLDKTIKTDLGKFERELYKINKVFFQFKPGQVLLQDLIFIYPKIQVDSYSQNSQDSSFIKDLNLIIIEDPNITIKFRILEKIINLLSGLAAKWKVFKLHKYLYRMNPRIQCSKIINIEKVNSTCYSLDTFWFCAAISEDLLDEISTLSLKQASEILTNQLNQILKIIFKEKILKPQKPQQKRSSFLKKCNRLSTVSSEPGSISLNLPSLFSRLLCKKKSSFASSLHSLLSDLDMSYRFFEKELISRFLPILSHTS